MAKTTVAQLEARVLQLEELVKALTTQKTVLHRPARPAPTDPVGTYPHTDGRGRKYRDAGGGVRAFAPLQS